MMWRGDDRFLVHSDRGVGSLVGAVLMILFWLVVVWAIVVLVRHFAYHNHPHYDHDRAAKPEDPVAIAKARYAKGEITKAEFEQLKKDLK